MSSHSDTKKRQAMTSEKKSGGREATRTILEDVCSDFETMNVIAPKTNKVGVIKNAKIHSTQKQSDTSFQKDKNTSCNTTMENKETIEKLSSPTSNKEIISKISRKNSNDISSNETVVGKEKNERKSLIVTNNVPTNASHQNESNDLIRTVETSIDSGIKPFEPAVSSATVSEVEQLQSSVSSAILNTESNVHINSELLPLNSCQDPGNISIVPESFAVEKNLSSLAQLADAEIVQSGDNVSIVVSNPRFIEVLTNASAPISALESGAVIETPATVLETNIGSGQSIELVDSSLLTSSTFAKDLNLIQGEISSSKTDAQVDNFKTPKKRGRPPKRPSSPPPSYIPSTHFTRGRRVTSRMKAAWTRLLEMDGRLVCQMPGCSQTFVTVANFQTHFKYCSGKKTLQKCDYCDSMIFSTHKAILQHMEVEHPEKADEYRAAHQEEILEFEKNNAPDHLVISEDENVAMNVEEVTQNSQNISRKRKLSEKESSVPNKKVILKHKLQSIQNSMAENAKEFKKCVRFDTITDAIKSVNISSLEEACRIETPVKKIDKRVKRVFNETIVAADKYFEDDEDIVIADKYIEVDDDPDQPRSEDDVERQRQELREKMHTKARLMLNLERYKRYQEYLTVTRDWSSERRTYSRSRGSDVSTDNSFTLQMLNESFQNIHQLNDMTESSISLNTSEAEVNSIQLPNQVETYQVVETPHFVSAVSVEPDEILTSTPNEINVALSLFQGDLSSAQPPIYSEHRVRREKTACYNRVNFENFKPKPKLGGIITYGVNVPGEVNSTVDKTADQPVTFDSLVNFMKPKANRRNSQTENIENIPKPEKENSAKLPNDPIISTPKKKRGRPFKSKEVSAIDSKDTKQLIKMQKSGVKKYSAAMLKTIERNIKNKKVKLFGIKKKSNSKKYASVRARKLNLKNIKMKQSKNNKMKQSKNNSVAKKFGVKKAKRNKKKKIDQDAIQCQENIDNHLSINQELNISCLSSENNYTNTLNQMIVAGELEISPSNIEQVSQNVIDESKGLSENVYSEQINKEIECADEVNLSNIEQVSQNVIDESKGLSENVYSEQINKEIECADEVNLSKNNLQTSSENLSLNETVEKPLGTVESSDKEKSNEINLEKDSNQRDILNAEKSSDSVQVEKSSDESVELMQKDTENNDICAKVVQKDLNDNTKSGDPMPKDSESNQHAQLNTDSSSLQETQLLNKSCDEQIQSDLNNSVTKQSISDNEPLNDLNANNIEVVQAPQSDVNENIENKLPEIPVKRGRGRPKKNSKRSIPKIPKTKKSQQDTSIDHEFKKSKPIVNETKLNDEDNTTSETKLNDEDKDNNTTSEIADDSQTISNVRKSERIRRRKVVDDEILPAAAVETKQKEVSPAIPVTQSKGRGRPRKHPIQDSPIGTSDVKTVNSLQKTPEIESEAVDENLRKFSRKGRPRKCVRYADLNSGLESSESMDGTHSGNVGKNKSDSTKEKNAKNVQKTRNSKEVIESLDDSKESSENIILPLKKRKQRQTKKNESNFEKSKVSKTGDDEILLSEEESQDKIEENEDASGKRTLRSRKRGTKRKKANSSDEEWDPEVHLKNSGKSLGQKSHTDIFALEESSDSSSSERKDPTFTKKGDANRKTSSKPSNIKRLDVVAAKYSLKTSKELFLDHKPQKWMWKLLSGDDYILPPMKTSPYFKIKKLWNQTETYWNSMNLFDSVPIDKDSCHGTFFTGGPVTCSAWCPTPVENNKVQYIALAVSSLMNKIHSYVCDEPERGYLQLWNVGNLNKKALQTQPFMEISILHEYGPINDMVWCPFGCWENPEVENSSDILPRLGLLAVACSDSNVRIYSIPHPDLLPKEGTSFPIYSASPSVVLESLSGNICMVTRKSICVSLCWQKSDHCERIAAGYGCGMICVWLINTSATVLAVKENNQIIIKPYLVFSGHGTPVSGLSFSPLSGGRYLVSSSIDRTLKFWDLIDTSMPIYTAKRGAGKCGQWYSHYCGVFASIQYGMSNFKGSTFFKECGTECFSSRSLANPNCSIILSSLSEWLNAIAIGDLAGSVSVSYMLNLINEHMKGPHYIHRYAYESELQPVEGIVNKIIFSSYSESINCVEKIQEMKEIASVLDETVSLVCEVNDVVLNSVVQKSLEHHSEESRKVSCEMVIEEVKEVVSVVHHITENCEPLILDSKEKVEEDFIADDSEKECNLNDEEQLCKIVPNELSGVTDIVTLVTDINDVTETVANILCSSQVNASPAILSSSSDSLMEVDDFEVPNEVIITDAIEAALDIVQLLDTLLNAVDQDESSVYQKIAELSNNSEQLTDESIIANIHSENVACISAVDEMSNVVTVVENLAERSSKSDDLNVSGQTNSESLITDIQRESIACVSTVDEISNIVTIMENLSVQCSRPEFISEFYAIISKRDGETYSSHFQIAGCILQKIKDVIFIAEEISERCCKLKKSEFGIEPCLKNSEFEKDRLTDCLTVSFNELTSNENEGLQSKKGICNKIGLTHNLSEIVDIVSTVSDIQDATDTVSSMNDAIEIVLSMKDTAEAVSDMNNTTEILSDMKDTAEIVCDLVTVTETASDIKNVISSSEDLKDIICSAEDLKDIICSAEDLKDIVGSAENLKDIVGSAENLKDIVGSAEDLKDIIGSAEDLKDVTIVAEKLGSEIAGCKSSQTLIGSLNNENCIDNVQSNSISLIIKEIVDSVSKEIDSEFEAMKVMSDLLSNIEMASECVVHENEISSQVSNEKFMYPSEVPCSFTTNSSTEMTENDENLIKCDNSLSKDFDYQLPELSDEMDEQMLSADSESSNSDNDIDDEMEVDDSYMFDQDSNLSGDSVLSEWSLDSAASICSFSTESDMSVDSVASIQGDQEADDLVPNHQNNIAEVVETSSRSLPKLSDLTFEGKVASNAESSNMESNIESSTTDVLDISKPSKDSNEEVVQENNLNVVTDTIVPDSHDCDFSEDRPTSETVDSLCNQDVVEVSTNSEIPTEILDQVEPEAATSDDILPVDCLNKSDSVVHVNDVVSEMPCDKISCTVETAKISVDSSNETCTESDVKESTDKISSVTNDESISETIPDSCNSNSVLPETVESISKPNDTAVIAVDNFVNTEQNESPEINNSSSEVESCVVNKKCTSENFSCYEDVISQYGIVFKDLNTAKFDKLEHKNFKELSEYSLSSYHLTSVKTVSWNPNYGSHNWLFSAGHSGIARLSYISDLSVQTHSEKKSK